MSGERKTYEELSNEELTRVLHTKFPELMLWPVTDDTRNTAIAMLMIARKTADTNGASKGRDNR